MGTQEPCQDVLVIRCLNVVPKWIKKREGGRVYSTEVQKVSEEEVLEAAKNIVESKEPRLESIPNTALNTSVQIVP